MGVHEATKLGVLTIPPPLENKESADEGLFQICPGGHDFEKEVGKRRGIMICGEEASKTHFDR